jgi:hypothetical protein
MNNRYRLLAILMMSVAFLSAQVRINEAVSSNSVYLDEDGDSPDWLELHNPGSQAIDLTNYTLSDKANNPGKWTIPNLNLAPGAYAFFWASGKDRTSSNSFRTFINRGDTFRYLIPTQSVGQSWKNTDFNDDNWAEGPTGIGYGDGDDNTQIPNGTISVFARKSFTINDLAGIEALIFDIDFDDGFIAYLNGVEIARENLSIEDPVWTDFADMYTEPLLINEAPPRRFVLDNPEEILRAGENVLAIQVHNSGPGSSDFSMIPFLSARYAGASTEGITPPAILGLTDEALHTNFRISAGGETLFLHDANGNFVDSLPVYNLPADVSVGIPGNGGQAVLLGETTPGQRNPNQGFQGVVAQRVLFSAPGGQVSPLTLALSGVSAPNEIHYTTDGSEPTINAPTYSGPIPINQTRVVRAAAFRPGYLPSRITTETYLINTNHSLPVVSLVTEPDNFFHPVTGMYLLGQGYTGEFPFFGSNIWEDREEPVNFAFYEPDNSGSYSLDAGTKIFGGWSRGQEQRSLSVFARGRYGTSEMEYPFFPQRSYDTFQALVLRNSGNDLFNTGMRDVVMTGLMENSNQDIQAYQSVASYINGRYWGLFNLREKVNEHFLASKHGVDPESIDLLEFNAAIIQGSNAEYLALLEYARTNPIEQAVHYNYLAEQIDIDNYIQYQAAQIYFDNQDWPGNNIKYWKSPDTKWRWILFDTDFGAAIWNSDAAFFNTLNFALVVNGQEWPNPPWSTLLFRRLMTNQTFRNRFINQLADEMNSRFLPQAVIQRINTHANLIEEEIERHDQRWGRAGIWEDNVERMRQFFRERPEPMKGFVRNHFNLPAHHQINVSISDTSQGYVRVNSLDIEQNNWSGDYFQNVPIKVTAIPKEGFRFLHWELDNTSDAAELTLNMTRRLALRPVFVEDPVSVAEPDNNLRSVSGITVSPNPTDGPLQMRFTVRQSTHLSAALYDAQGRQLQSLFNTSFRAGPQVQSLDLSTLPSGAYSLLLREESGGRAVVKVMVR